MSKYPEKMRDMISETIRNNIHQAGIDIIREAGWNSFTTEKIAERVGVSRGVLYNYFKNKEEIAHSIIEASFENFTRKLADLANLPETAESRLRKMAQLTVNDFMQQREMHRAFMENLPPTSPGKADHPAVKGHLRKDELFFEVIKSGISSGEFVAVNVEAAGTLLQGGLQELCIKSIFSPQAISPDNLIDIFLKGIKR